MPDRWKDHARDYARPWYVRRSNSRRKITIFRSHPRNDALGPRRSHQDKFWKPSVRTQWTELWREERRYLCHLQHTVRLAHLPRCSFHSKRETMTWLLELLALLKMKFGRPRDIVALNCCVRVLEHNIYKGLLLFVWELQLHCLWTVCIANWKTLGVPHGLCETSIWAGV